MNALPPSWDAWHPLIVHFPIALLLAAPVLILLRFAAPKLRAGLGAAALTLLLLGSGSAWLAVSTGEAAGEKAEKRPGVEAAVEAHEEAAEAAAWIFTALAAVYAGLLLAERRIGPKPAAAAAAAFLALHLGGSAVLADAAHKGGVLVHVRGVHAPLGGADAGAVGGTPLSEGWADED